MQYIIHRKNTIAELKAISEGYGVEIDLRTHQGQLTLHHDPFVSPEACELFEQWLQVFTSKPRGTLILNVKEAALEDKILDLMDQHGVTDFFFLDQPAPYLISSAFIDEKKMARMQRRIAVRVSQYEPVEAALIFKGKANWAWIDCFGGLLTLTREESNRLKEAGFQLCLVSPELQGCDPTQEIPKMFSMMQQGGIKLDAICTKRPDLWQKIALTDAGGEDHSG